MSAQDSSPGKNGYRASRNVAVALAVFHLCVGALFIAIALPSLGLPHAFLAGVSLLCVAWGLIRERPWVIVPQIVALIAAAIIWHGYLNSPGPYRPQGAGLGDLIGLLIFWALMLATLVVGIATAIHEAFHFLNATADDPARDWRSWIVEAVALSLIAAAIVVGGDYALPAHRASAEADQAAERKAAAEAAEKRQKAEEKRREALMKAAFSDLESAVRGNDTAGVARAIDQVRRDDYGEFWRASLHAASREAQLVLLREMHYSRLRSLLEEPEIDPEVRHRLAVITMKEHSGGPVRKMGALRDVSTHDLLVWVVADAIGDRINARGGK